MSTESWKAEFYPITAKQAAKRSKLFAVEHSLQKWLGLRKSSLKKHGLAIDQEPIRISDTSCSLCQKYRRQDYALTPHRCSYCPLFEVRDGVACYESREEENGISPWADRERTVEPMIHWLRKAKKMVEKGKR